MTEQPSCLPHPKARGLTRAKPKRQQILDGAHAVFVRHGYWTASMEEIARVAGVSKTTLYSHFEGKDALFEAVLVAGADRISCAIPPVESFGTDLSSILPQLGRAVAEALRTPLAESLLRLVIEARVRTHAPRMEHVLLRLCLARTAVSLADAMEPGGAVRKAPSDARRAASERFLEDCVRGAVGDLFTRDLFQSVPDEVFLESR